MFCRIGHLLFSFLVRSNIKNSLFSEIWHQFFPSFFWDRFTFHHSAAIFPSFLRSDVSSSPTSGRGDVPSWSQQRWKSRGKKGSLKSRREKKSIYKSIGTLVRPLWRTQEPLATRPFVASNVLESITYPPDRSNLLMLSTRIWLVLSYSIPSQWGSVIDASLHLGSLTTSTFGQLNSFELGVFRFSGGIEHSSNRVCKTMSAGLAVVWQVSFLNKFCWIWSSGVVINRNEHATFRKCFHKPNHFKLTSKV